MQLTWLKQRSCVALRDLKPARFRGKEEVLVQLIHVTRCRRWRRTRGYLLDADDSNEHRPCRHYSLVLCAFHSRFMTLCDCDCPSPLALNFRFV